MIDVLEIREKRKGIPQAIVSPDDFVSSKVGDADPAVLISDPTVSLYCLDHPARRALFVKVPEGTDVTTAAFMYSAQYDHAERLYAVPYDVLQRVAAGVELNDSLVLVYSTGRAGSTLVSKAFDEIGAVTSLSEPDVYTRAVALRSDGVPDSEIRDLLASSTRILFNPAFTRGSALNVVKFRGFCIELGDLLFVSFPKAKSLFLYRDLAAYIRSFLRAMPFDNLPPEARRGIVEWGARMIPLLAEEAGHRSEFVGMELFCLAWLSVMRTYIRLMDAGVPMLPVRYEDLNADPIPVLEKILAHVGLPSDQARSALRAFERDSQAGSPLSREEVARHNITIDERQWPLVRDLVRRYPLAGGGIPSQTTEVP